MTNERAHDPSTRSHYLLQPRGIIPSRSKAQPLVPTTIPVLEEPLNPIYVHHQPGKLPPRSLVSVGYFSASLSASVLDPVIDSSPDDGEYWEIAVIIVLGNPDTDTEGVHELVVSHFSFHSSP